MFQTNFKESQQPHAVLIGLDSLQGLQAARILARHNVPIIALTNDPNHHCSRTNVCQEKIYSETKSDEVIKTLEDLGQKLSQKAVLFPCEDANVLLVSRYRELLKNWYHVILPAPDVVEILMNKISFHDFAEKNGFRVPRTFLLKNKTDIKQAVEKLNFPCIMKPPISAAPEWEQNTMQKAFRVSGAEELFTLYNHYSRWADAFIVQEVVEGPDTNHYSCNCYFDIDSEPIVTFVTRKLRQWPPKTGQGCLGEEYYNDVVLTETIRLFRSVNYHGLGYLEMKCDARSGEYFMIEPNIGRPTGRSATTEAGGVELLYTMYCDAVGWPLPENRQQKYEGVKWIYLRQDLQAALLEWRQGNLSLTGWWQSFRGRKTYALFSWPDPAPFISDVTRVARVLLSTEERRKRNYQNQLI